MIFGLTACSGNPAPVASESTENAETKVVETETTGSEPVEETTTAGSDETYQETTAGTGKDVLVIYFSATGKTKGVAEMIADITDGDLYEIKALEEYTDEDLNWNDSNSRSTKEQDDPSARSVHTEEEDSAKALLQLQNLRLKQLWAKAFQFTIPAVPSFLKM